jgi:hypothetical protein
VTEEQIAKQADSARHTAERGAERKWGWLLLISVIGNILTLVLAVAWVARVNTSTEQKFCAVLAIQLPPAVTAREFGVAAAIEKLRSDLGCVPHPIATPTTYGPPPAN